MIQNDSWTTLKLISWTREYLTSKGVKNARNEAEWLLCEATGLDRIGLYLNFEAPLNPDELAKFRSFVLRRGKREPLQHILGTQEFYGLEFEVSPDVLIPRHDTEILIEQSLLNVPDANKILDVGTGSGCIAITLAHKYPGASVTAVDISDKALAVARRNAQRLGVDVQFLEGSLFKPVAGISFDLIVSNPPYIRTADLPSLEPEVRDYDPEISLDGGVDGLKFYATLISDAPSHLNTRGWMILEIGAGQEIDVFKMFEKTGLFSTPVTALDHSGIIRVVGAQKL